MSWSKKLETCEDIMCMQFIKC